MPPQDKEDVLFHALVELVLRVEGMSTGWVESNHFDYLLFSRSFPYTNDCLLRSSSSIAPVELVVLRSYTEYTYL